MTVKETLDVISKLIDYHILDGYSFTTIKYISDKNPIILFELITDIRNWVNNVHKNVTTEDIEKEWNIVPGTFKNFIENFQKVNWNNLFRFI